jgi:hypothetical protein
MSSESSNRSDSTPLNRIPSVLPCAKCHSLGAKAVPMSLPVWPEVHYYRCAKCGHLWSIRIARSVDPE